MRESGLGIEFKASEAKSSGVWWLIGAAAMWLGCAVVLAACGPKKMSSGRESVEASPTTWVFVKFEVEDEETISEAFALVNPWELKEGEAWHCGVPSGDHERVFFATIQRDKMSSSGFVMGLQEMKEKNVVAISAGSFPVKEEDGVALNLGGEQSRTVMLKVISGELAKKVMEEVKDLVECEKRENVLVPEQGK